MNPVSTQLEMSAASIRLAGYVIESNLRVAQIIGQAALSSNPFTIPADMRKHVSTARRSLGTEAKESESKAVRKKTAKPAKPKAKKTAEPAIAKKAFPAETKPATNSKPTNAAAVKVEKSAKSPAPKKKSTRVEAEVKVAAKSDDKIAETKFAKRVSKKPEVATPEFRSRVVRSATPNAAETAKVTAPATPAKATMAPKAVSDEIQTGAAQAASKSHREPSAPPAMPARGKVTSKG